MFRRVSSLAFVPVFAILSFFITDHGRARPVFAAAIFARRSGSRALVCDLARRVHRWLVAVVAAKLRRSLRAWAHAQEFAPPGNRLCRDAPPVADGDIGLTPNRLGQAAEHDKRAGTLTAWLADRPGNPGVRDPDHNDFSVADLVNEDLAEPHSWCRIRSEVESEAIDHPGDYRWELFELKAPSRGRMSIELRGGFGQVGNSANLQQM